MPPHRSHTEQRIAYQSWCSATKAASLTHEGPNVRHERQTTDGEAGCWLSARWRGWAPIEPPARNQPTAEFAPADAADTTRAQANARLTEHRLLLLRAPQDWGQPTVPTTSADPTAFAQQPAMSGAPARCQQRTTGEGKRP